MSKLKLSYKEQFRIMNKEALATLILAVIITAFFWGSVFLLKDSSLSLFYMPLWFVVSCAGGYLLSVVGVIILTKKFMSNFSLENSDKDHLDE